MNPFLGAWWKMTMLGLEAQQVIALRLLQAAAGRPLNIDRLVSEKIGAASRANQALGRELALGGTPITAANKAIDVYKRKVGSNRRRLSRPR
ncbi:MAG: hypothetical protein U1E67_04635 [Hyphomicrobiales bacterium]